MSKRTRFLRHVTREEQALLDAVVRFANLKIKSTQQVEQLFMASPLAARAFKVLPARNVEAYREDQATVRMWLGRLATSGAAARKTIGPEVAERLARTVLVRLTYDTTTHTVGVSGFLDGVEACFSYATALLLDRHRGLAGRIGRCGWSRCGRFRLHRGEAGRPRQHCTITHRRRAEAEGRKAERRAQRAAREARAEGPPGKTRR
jgi:hypothetical protein